MNDDIDLLLKCVQFVLGKSEVGGEDVPIHDCDAIGAKKFFDSCR